MRTRYTATQSIDLAVPQQTIPIQHYLRQPKRLIQALVDSSRVEVQGQNEFRLKMKPLNFLSLSVQPTVDLQLTPQSDGTILLKSTRCEIRGFDYVNSRFHLDLQGRLTPVQDGAQTTLQGQADLEVAVDLPPFLWLTPRPILEATGNGLLRSVLSTMKQRLTHQLLADYQTWVHDQTQSQEAQSGQTSSGLSPNSSMV